MEKEYNPDDILRDPPENPDEAPLCEVCGTVMVYLPVAEKYICPVCNPEVDPEAENE